MDTQEHGYVWGVYLNTTSLALTFILLCISTLVFRTNAKSNRQSKLGARAFPLGFGVTLQLVRQLRANTVLEWTQKVLNVPGRTVEVPIGGIVMTDNTENIRAIMSTQSDCFGKGETYHKIWSSLMRDSILTTDGHAWQVNRNHLVAHTAKIRPTDYAVTDRHAQNLIRVLSDGMPHDTLDQLNRFAIDVVSDIFYGSSTNTLLTNDQSLRDAIQRHKNVNTWRLLFGKIGTLMPPDREACDVIEKYLDHVVDTFSLEDSESQEEHDRKAQTLLGVLSAQGVSKKVLKDQLVAVLVGGRDSVAIAVTWALYELVRHPETLRELRAELSKIVGPSDPPSSSQLEGLEFLNSVVQETMRVHSSVGMNVRSALKDTSLPTGGGLTGTSPVGILAGTSVVLGLDSLHHRTDIFGPDADVYRPHRWDNHWKPDTWTYFPFNRGARPCLGKNLALMEVKFVLCRLLQAFGSIEMVEKIGDEVVTVNIDKREKIRTKMAFNTKPAEPVWLRFRR
ncbi:cytochrome P450 [Massariosphaeria phaeospora]|uniref:Cytochrome P450 n=1 Tax=Massariosphaeria phaeospora TaxID=100035 RepID=A0A7C8M0B1_9PLEO|nr:cytochrome P450 [Massariosphaeria phaeospora]